MEKLLDTHLSGQYGLTAKIKDALMEVRHQFVYIGFLLDEADRLEYYREGGYESIYEYCEDTFGFKKSSTNNFIRVYRTFGEYMGLQERYRDYSYSQLTEMCSMTERDLARCKPDMTVADIRLLKKGEVFQTSGKVEPESDPVQTSGQDEETMAVTFNNMWVDVPVSVYRAFWDAIPSFAKKNIRFGCHDIEVSYHKNT